MKMKFDEKGSPVFDGENPVFVLPDGKEEAVDVKALYVEKATAKREAAEMRVELKKVQDLAAKYEGIDPETARKALAFQSSAEGKKILGDEDFQKMLQSNLKPLHDENAALKAEAEKLKGEIFKERVGKNFSTSEFLKKTRWAEIPEDAEEKFSKFFSCETDGSVVARDYNGNVIYNSKGEVAGFEEAFAHLVNTHPKKDHYLAGSGASGAGTKGTSGGGFTGGIKSRADFKTDSEKAAYIGENGLDAFKALPSG